MSLSDRFVEGIKNINKVFLIVLIPIVLDVFQLLLYQHIFKTSYIPASRSFIIKVGFIPVPPEASYLLEDFPSVLLKYNANGSTGIINELSLFNILLTVTYLLISSFISSGYLSVVSEAGKGKVRIRDFFILGNKLWFKFFILGVFYIVPIALILYRKEFIILEFVWMVFVYVPYSLTVDNKGIIESFKRALHILVYNLGATIKLALFLGVIFSLLGIVVLPLASQGLSGIIMDIAIISYLGTVANKVVLEVYRDLSNASSRTEVLSPQDSSNI